MIVPGSSIASAKHPDNDATQSNGGYTALADDLKQLLKELNICQRSTF
jgi:hypothetical protein